MEMDSVLVQKDTDILKGALTFLFALILYPLLYLGSL